jgi:hypothetical protein
MRHIHIHWETNTIYYQTIKKTNMKIATKTRNTIEKLLGERP